MARRLTPTDRRDRKTVRRRGVYRRCRAGFLRMRACNGDVVVNGVAMRHTPCGGDGWIRVGTTTSSGRAPRGRRGRSMGRPPRRHRTWRQRKAATRKLIRRQVRTAGTGGGVMLVAYLVGGTVAVAVVAVLLVVVLVLSVGTRVRRMGGAR